MSVEVVTVRGKRALRTFVGLPWTLYDRKRHPQWVPPLRDMVRDALDTKNPFYESAERELFLALRDGKPVGRIAAIHNRRHNEFHGEAVGFFGFFESIDDLAVALALLDAAGTWLAARGLGTLRGPVNPSTNHECGLLVDGFDTPAAFMTPWNPPYYADLLEGNGLAKAKDLLAFWIPLEGFELPDRYRRVAERVRERSPLQFRLLDRSRFGEEAERVWTIYNDAWERNWGFVPMTRAEFDHTAEMLKHLVLEEFAYFAEIDGEPAAFALALPDYNLTLRRIPGGRLLPFGLPMLLWDRTRIRRGRIILLGVREQFRSKSIYFLFMIEFLRRGRAYGAEGAEASWILEDNEPVIDFFREAGLPASKRWRLYERPLARPGP